MSETEREWDRKLLRLYLEHFGLREGLRMFGWCILWGAMGIETWSDLERAKPPKKLRVHEATWYRAVAEFRKFRAKVAEYREMPEGELARRIVQAAEREGPRVFASVGVD